MLWGIQWTDVNTDESTLCEVESGVVYECGSQLNERLAANALNNDVRKNGWPSRYRAVPLPWTGPMPEYVRRRR